MDWRNLASDEEFRKLKQFCKENAIEWKIETHKDYVFFLFTYLPTMWRFGYRANNSWFDTITSRIRLQNSLISFLISKLVLYKEKEESYMKIFTVNGLNLANNTYTDYMVNYMAKFNHKNPKIEKVIFSGPCTIVLWSDGDKTMVRCENESFDKEKGLAMAIAKKFLGTNTSKSNYYDIFEKWIPEEEVKTVEETEEAEEAEEVYYSVRKFAKLLGISESTVLRYLRNGQILGARKEKGKWVIPFPG